MLMPYAEMFVLSVTVPAVFPKFARRVPSLGFQEVLFGPAATVAQMEFPVSQVPVPPVGAFQKRSVWARAADIEISRIDEAVRQARRKASSMFRYPSNQRNHHYLSADVS